MTGTAVEVEGVHQIAIANQSLGEEPIKVKEIAKTEVTIRVTLVIAQPLVRDKRKRFVITTAKLRVIVVVYPTCKETCTARKER